jgi:hypothetical protein
MNVYVYFSQIQVVPILDIRLLIYIEIILGNHILLFLNPHFTEPVHNMRPPLFVVETLAHFLGLDVEQGIDLFIFFLN